MKTTLHVSLKFLSLIAAAFLLIFTSCKKNDSATYPPSLFGQWMLTPGTDHIEHSLNFSPDSTFRLLIVNWGNPANPVQDALTGTFKTEGKSLKITIMQSSHRENNNPATTAPASDKIYENATFTLKDDKLILNYTSSPADTPVATKATFTKMLIAL